MKKHLADCGWLHLSSEIPWHLLKHWSRPLHALKSLQLDWILDFANFCKGRDKIGKRRSIISKSRTRISWSTCIGCDKGFPALFLFLLKRFLPLILPNLPLIVFSGRTVLHIFLLCSLDDQKLLLSLKAWR